MPVNVSNCHQLDYVHVYCRLSPLKHLKVLQLTENELSAGLPSAIGEIDTLNRLEIYKCGLKTLPQR